MLLKANYFICDFFTNNVYITKRIVYKSFLLVVKSKPFDIIIDPGRNINTLSYDDTSNNL